MTELGFHRDAVSLSPKAERWSLLLTLCGLALVYVLTYPHAHTISDSHEWMTALRHGTVGYLFHPHHLVYNALAWLWSRPLVAMGMGGWGSVQSLSLLGGLAAAAALYLTLLRVLRNPLLASLGTCAYGFCFSTWLFATDVEVYIFAAAGLLWSFYLLLRACESNTTRAWLLVGCACGGAGLFHQTCCFFLVPVCVGAWMHAAAWRTRVRNMLLPVLGFAITAGIPYILVGVFVGQANSVGTLFRWMTKHAQYGYYGGLSASTPLKVLIGLARSFIYGSALMEPFRAETFAWTLSAAFVVVCLCAVGVSIGVLLVTALRRFRFLTKEYYPAVPLAAVWFAANGLFSIYYEPQNVEWWCIPLPPLLILLVCAASAIPKRLGVACLGVLAFALFVGNLFGDFLLRRNPDFDRFAVAARSLRTAAGDEGLIVAPATIVTRARGAAVSFHILVRMHKNDPAGALSYLRKEADSALRRGGGIAFLEEIMAPEKFSYQPHAKPAAQALQALTKRFATKTGEIILPWEMRSSFPHIAKYRALGVYHLLPNTQETAAWLDALAALEAHSRLSGKQSPVVPNPSP